MLPGLYACLSGAALNPVMAVTEAPPAVRCSLQPTGNVLAMADEAGGVALWRDAIPEDELDVAALRAAPSPVAADADVADDPTAHGDSLEGSLGEPGVPSHASVARSLSPSRGMRPTAHAELSMRVRTIRTGGQALTVVEVHRRSSQSRLCWCACEAYMQALPPDGQSHAGLALLWQVRPAPPVSIWRMRSTWWRALHPPTDPRPGRLQPRGLAAGRTACCPPPIIRPSAPAARLQVRRCNSL